VRGLICGCGDAGARWLEVLRCISRWELLAQIASGMPTDAVLFAGEKAGGKGSTKEQQARKLSVAAGAADAAGGSGCGCWWWPCMGEERQVLLCVAVSSSTKGSSAQHFMCSIESTAADLHDERLLVASTVHNCRGVCS
jgi:hypothetical protein